MRFFVSCCVADPTAASKPVAPPPSRRTKPHWRPALGPISEDTAPPHTESPAADAKRTTHTASASASADAAGKARRQYTDDCDYGPKPRSV
ncbi:hypothetical protein Fmac_019107 [Flemingia macrophylla]|uniref:Uncharacterized protein n=1 Tax=Flemingia macrophylla TaxID=520843 RepID=A0ABD1M6Y1_9FABA